MAERTQVRRGTSATGMDHASWGDGPLTLVYLGGGPGSFVPSGTLSGSTQRWFAPFVDSGHTVHHLSRRRGMPRGHTAEDMADDVARFVTDELGGRADLVVGVSFGGMLAQHVAARHGRLLGRVALVAAAARLSPWGRRVDERLARALEAGETSRAGAAFGEYLLPGERWGPVRRVAGPFVGRMLTRGKHYPAGDVLVEVEAELGFDAREALPHIEVPVVLLCGDEDPFFPAHLVDETEALIPDCTRVRYPGRGHIWVSSNPQVPRDVQRWLDARSGA